MRRFYLAACLIWYDEAPEDLHRMVTSLKGFADGVVALDGAFRDFPIGEGDPPWSSADQAKALAEGCAESGMELLLHQPDVAGKWPLGYEGNEVEKRNASVALAGLALNATWVFNIDADMYLYDAGNSRELLAKTQYSVAMTDIEGTPARHHLFRWSPTLRFQASHWIVVDGKKLYSGTDQMLLNGEYPNGLEPYIDLRYELKFDHPARTDFWRRARQNAWYQIRDSRQIEYLP